MHTTLHRYALITALYVSQAIPLGFFVVAMPAILRREGLSLEGVGLLSALAVPWLLKFSWAPIVDRFGPERGHYRAWILPLQLVSIAAVLLISQVDLTRGLGWLLVAGAIYMISSATQDIATDGLAVRVIALRERGVANGIQVGGYYLGQIAGGGAVLVLYAAFGWTVAVLAMGALLAVLLTPVWGFKEPPKPAAAPRKAVDWSALRRFVSRPGGRAWALVLISFRAGEGLALTMLNPMLVDRGFDLASIGVTLGVVGSFASLGGALVGGAIVARLGRRLSLVTFGLFQAAAILGHIVPAVATVGLVAVSLVVCLAAFAGGLATTALYTNMMDRCDQRTAATDFTLQQSLAAVGPMCAAMTSGFLAAALGYELHFVMASSVALAAVVLVAVVLTESLAAPECEEPAQLASDAVA